MTSESSQVLPHISQYLNGSVLDIGSGGCPVVPWAIQMDLPVDEFKAYGGNRPQDDPIHLRQDGTKNLPFKDGSLDAVFSSHLLEDFTISQWLAIIVEWCRVVKPGGYLVIVVPDRQRFRAAVKSGQPDNPHHQHEATHGEITMAVLASSPRMVPIVEKLIDNTYSLIGVFQKSY